MLGPLALVSLFRPRLDLRARLRELGQTLLAQGQLFGNRHAVGDIGLVGRLGARQQIRHLGFQLRLELARVLPRKRAVTAGVGVDLRAVEADRSHLQHAHLAREQQHADEQPLDLLEKAPPKRGDRVVVGVVVGGDVAERHAVVSRPLKLAARKHPGGVAVNQNPQQHPGMVRRRAGAAIGPIMPPRSSPSITSTTKRAKCLCGSHSSTDGGSHNSRTNHRARRCVTDFAVVDGFECHNAEGSIIS